MTKVLRQMMKLGGMLTVVLGATTYNPLKASAQLSLLPEIDILEGGQVCLALCTSPRTTGVPPQPLGGLPSQLMQLPGQALQIPQQILSSQTSTSQVLRPNVPIPPGNVPMMPPGNPPMMPPGNPAMMPPQPAPAQARRPSFIQKIAPVLPAVIQQLSR